MEYVSDIWPKIASKAQVWVTFARPEAFEAALSMHVKFRFLSSYCI